MSSVHREDHTSAMRCSEVEFPAPAAAARTSVDFPLDPIIGSPRTMLRTRRTSSYDEETDMLNKDEWVALFRAAGLDEPMMRRWHQAFEREHPDEHEAFLRSLGLGDSEVARIRRESRDG